MAKKREIFKVDEDALKDMMASESISCGKSGADVGENVLPVTEKEKNVPEVKTQGQEKSRKTIRADPGLEAQLPGLLSVYEISIRHVLQAVAYPSPSE